MKITTRAASVAFAVAITVGITSPAATAAPGHGGGNPDHSHVTKPPKGDRKFAIEQRNALAQVARLDAQVAKAVVESRVGRLVPVNDVDVRTAVLDNAAADRAALAETAAAVRAAAPGFGFAALRADLRGVRPENYRIATNALRQAAGIDAAAEALGGSVDVDAAVDAAVAEAVLVTARSPKSDLAAVFAHLADARAALEALETPEEPEEPVEEPADTDLDGLSDLDEAALGTDATVADTDGGGASDGDEVSSGTDPLNPFDDVV